LGAGAAIFKGNFIIIAALAVVVTLIAFLIMYIRIVSRLLIVELPLAIENNIDASSAISRSWELTKGSVGRIQSIVFVAFLMSLPLYIVSNLLSVFFEKVLTALFGAQSSLFFLVYIILTLGQMIGFGALITPFWQVIKAIIYYDLRSRKEGLGLQIRDR